MSNEAVSDSNIQAVIKLINLSVSSEICPSVQKSVSQFRNLSVSSEICQSVQKSVRQYRNLSVNSVVSLSIQQAMKLLPVAFMIDLSSTSKNCSTTVHISGP